MADMSRKDVIERLDDVVNDYALRTRIWNEPITLGRARMFVLQHRQNTRQRNSVLKLRVATNCPVWDVKLRIIEACTEEIIADDKHADGRPHWEIVEDLGVALGLKREDIQNSKLLPSTQLCWLAWEALMSNRHWLEGLIANTCAERVNVPGYGRGEFREKGWSGMERRRWAEALGLEGDQLAFFKIHGEADLDHSNLGWHTVARYAKELHMEDAVVEACRVNLMVWENYFNGIVEGGDRLDAQARR
jgi:pyrroloquinoline quinone (PQQ) biosynthesis protein C